MATALTHPGRIWSRPLRPRATENGVTGDGSRSTGAAAHVVLVGLMGSGKSTVGALLAEELGRPLIDVDVVIEAQTGMTVRELWERGGEAAYRPLERDVVVHALSTDGPDVLAMPGGGVEEDLVRAALTAADTFTVWLRADPATLAERVGRSDHRALLGDHPLAVLEQQVAERSRTFASLADLVLDLEDRSPDDLAGTIAAAADAAGATPLRFGPDRTTG